MRILQLSSTLCLVFAALNAGTNTVAATSCADSVSTGDQNIGITAVEDAACASGGLGCFPDGDQCRFCKVSNSTESSHLLLCDDVPATATSSTNSTSNATEEAYLESAVDCTSTVSVGDTGVGISAVAASNPTCSKNGLGCFKSGQCRFCQKWATTQSSTFLKCSGLGASTTTSTTTTVPASTVASTSTSCSNVVTRAGLQGISYVSESRCNVASPTLLGCSARTSCRICRNFKNEANQYLMSCKVLQAQKTESAAVGSASTDTAKTEDVEIDSSAADTGIQSSSLKMTVSTEADADTKNNAAPLLGSSGYIVAAAAVVGVLAVVMMSAIYVKSRRDPMFDDIMTPDDGHVGDLLTPHGGNGPTPREGSLVMVVSQSSIATL